VHEYAGNVEITVLGLALPPSVGRALFRCRLRMDLLRSDLFHFQTNRCDLHHAGWGDSPVKYMLVRRKAIMYISLSELIELGRVMDATNAKIANEIIDAQDYALQRQREKAECSRMNVELALPALPGLQAG
jgi:hypothetical protein